MYKKKKQKIAVSCSASKEDSLIMAIQTEVRFLAIEVKFLGIHRSKVWPIPFSAKKEKFDPHAFVHFQEKKERKMKNKTKYIFPIFSFPISYKKNFELFWHAEIEPYKPRVLYYRPESVLYIMHIVIFKRILFHL